ncbi:MAG: beta-galactosidase, partial [Bacteroidota bacterium]|nr:beta-galactosidase [Bacteroidota bacterium]
AQPHSFEIKDGNFLLDKKPFHIYAGEMHYARIPQEYWRQRLQMIKAMGLNTVATYVFWNYHHPSPNVWDFKTGNHNLAKFIKIAQEEGLYVILRPGPYVCAEWDFGGFPWWFSTVKGMEIRTDNKPFLDSCRIYFQKLHQQIKGLHISEGGPIILTQVENEFGSYVEQNKKVSVEQHKKYNETIKTLLEKEGFKLPYYTADGTTLLEGGAVKNVLPAVNGEDNIEKLKKVVNKYNNNIGPYFIAEFYPGWLDHWAEPFIKVTSEEVIHQTEKYLENDVSFSYYMIHGGTNFGYTAGANYTNAHPIQPDITSYDYDAPISEAGWPTEKYKELRELMKKHVGNNLRDIPKPANVITIPFISINKTINFFDWISNVKAIESHQPKTFEELSQSNGYVLYSRIFNDSIKGMLRVNGLRDYATVYINGIKVGELNRYYKKFEINISIPAHAKLAILVESMGRINYGAAISDNLKGIVSPVYIDEKEITDNWEMIRAPLEQMPDLNAFKNKKPEKGEPVFYTASFELNKVGDTFLDMKNFSKGIVFVNGHHLGRFWNVGPQQTLYLPGCWLNKGRNYVIIFDQLNNKLNNTIFSKDCPVLDQLK